MGSSEITTNAETGEPLEEFYSLTEEQMVTMNEPARVAWALTRLQGRPEAETLIAKELTQALAEVSLLDTEKVKKANSWLLGHKLLDREGFAEPGSTKALQLSLNEDGHKFLEEAVEKAKA